MSRKFREKKLFAYVDGYNLYHGMMDKSYQILGHTDFPVLRKYLWLDMKSYISSFFREEIILKKIHYFTAPIRDNPEALVRQEAYWKALESIPKLKIHRGKFIKKYNRDGDFIGYEEKQTDVKFSLQSFDDAVHEEGLGAMAFVCADSDQVPTIERIIGLRKNIELTLICPPCRFSNDLAKLFTSINKTKYDRLRDNQFPEVVRYVRDDETIKIVRPDEWSNLSYQE